MLCLTVSTEHADNPCRICSALPFACCVVLCLFIATQSNIATLHKCLFHGDAARACLVMLLADHPLRSTTPFSGPSMQHLLLASPHCTQGTSLLVLQGSLCCPPCHPVIPLTALALPVGRGACRSVAVPGRCEKRVRHGVLYHPPACEINLTMGVCVPLACCSKPYY